MHSTNRGGCDSWDGIHVSVKQRLLVTLAALAIVLSAAGWRRPLRLNFQSLLSIDLTKQAQPTTITAARTGNTLYLQSSASTLYDSSTLSAALWEDRGDGRGGGTWTLPPFGNDITAPFDHSIGAGWTQFGTLTYSPAAGIGPDGSTPYDEYNDTSTTQRVQIYGTWGAAISEYRAHSEWVRAAAPAPTAGGALTGWSTGSPGTNFTTSQTWNRVVTIVNTNPTHAHMGPGSTVPGPVFDLTATGAFDIWGDQSAPNVSVDVPLVNGSTTAATLRVATGSLSKVLANNGDFDVQGSFWTEEPTSLLDNSGYVYSMSSPSGAFSLRYDAALNNGTWTFAAKGVDLLTLVQQGSPIGALVSWHTWYAPSTGLAGFSLRINGAQDQTAGMVTGAAAAGALSTPTAFWVGSNLGASVLPVRHTLLAGTTTTTLLGEFVVLGDSICAYHGFNQPITSSFVYSTTEPETRPGIASLAIVANTIAQQQAQYVASPYFGASYVKGFLLQVGINDINAGTSGATVVSSLQSLINLIKTNNPNAKILIALITPDKAYSDTLNVAYYAQWQAANAGIPSLTNVDAVITTGSNTLNDGAGNLQAQYDSGDGIHPNYAGRVVLGAAWRAGLHALGLI